MKFPIFVKYSVSKKLCRLVGFSDGQTATFVKGKPLEYAGELYSEEHKRKFKTEKVRQTGLNCLAIDRSPLTDGNSTS